MDTVSTVPIIARLALAAYFMVALKFVRIGSVSTIERFGKYTKSLSPGLSLINPFCDRVGYRMNVMEQVREIPSMQIITADNAVVSVDGILFFQIVDPVKAAYEVSKLEKSIVNVALLHIQSVLELLKMDEMLSSRPQIKSTNRTATLSMDDNLLLISCFLRHSLTWVSD